MLQALDSAGAVIVAVAAGLGGGCDAGDTTPAAPAGAKAATQPTEPSDPSDPPAKGEPALPPKAPHFQVSNKVVTTVSGQGEGPYRFTAPWHTHVMDNWAKILGGYGGKADLTYLEIGVFEGRSLLWMFENVLTDASCTATAIDVFMGDYEQTFDANVEASKVGARIKKIKAPSRTALRAMSSERFDIIYIDGSHTADDVMIDATLSWDLLKIGGIMIFDDYEWTGRPQGVLPMELRPQVAIDLFITAYRGELQLLHRGYQVFVRKVENPCKPKDYCTPIGQYQYYWRDVELRGADGRKVELTPEEVKWIEGIAQAKGIGQTRPRITPEAQQSKPFEALVKRLDLDLEAP